MSTTEQTLITAAEPVAQEKTPEQQFADDTAGFIGLERREETPATDPVKPEGDKPSDAVQNNAQDSDPAAQGKTAETPAPDAQDKPKSQKHLRKIERQAKQISALEARIAELEGSQNPTAQARPDPEPDEADYRTFDEYKAALKEWTVKQAKAEVQASTPATQSVAKQLSPEVERAVAEIQDSFPDAAQKHADFQKAIDENGAKLSSDEILIALADCDEPGEVAYYLCTHANEAEALWGLNQRQTDRAIAKIEERLKSAAPAQVQTKKISNAPAPIVPVGHGPFSGDKKPSEMTMAEFEAWDKQSNAGKEGGRW